MGRVTDDLPPPQLPNLQAHFVDMRFRAASLGKHEQVRAAPALQLNLLRDSQSQRPAS
jgi:hypothetical protein